MNQSCAGLQPLIRLPLFFALLLAAAGCKRSLPPPSTYQMGEKAAAGKLVYVVSHAEWKTQLGEGAAARIPAHRFLLLHLSVTNSGVEAAALPLFQLVNAKGASYRELEDGSMLPGWLGLLRNLKPVETIEGVILFDVPPANYKLQITDAGPPGEEITAYIDIKLVMDTDPALSTPPAIPFPEKK